MGQVLNFARVLGAVILIFATASEASGACSSNSCTSQVKRLIVDSGGAFVQLTTALTPLNCSPDSKIFIRLLKTHANYDSLYQGLILSKTIGDSITIRIDEMSKPCTLNYLILEE
jgi:hypothetical protein